MDGGGCGQDSNLNAVSAQPTGSIQALSPHEGQFAVGHQPNTGEKKYILLHTVLRLRTGCALWPLLRMEGGFCPPNPRETKIRQQVPNSSETPALGREMKN